jgi:hypothetical protein
MLTSGQGEGFLIDSKNALKIRALAYQLRR